jgi:hypothetical protein
MFVAAGRVKNSRLEWSLLSLAALVQLGVLVAGWGDFDNVHGGAILMIWIILVGLAVFLGELVLAFSRPSWWRFLQLIGVAAFSVLLVAVGGTYGG